MRPCRTVHAPVGAGLPLYVRLMISCAHLQRRGCQCEALQDPDKRHARLLQRKLVAHADARALAKGAKAARVAHGVVLGATGDPALGDEGLRVGEQSWVVVHGPDRDLRRHTLPNHI